MNKRMISKPKLCFSVLLILIFIAICMISIFLRNYNANFKIKSSLLTVDSLITGATITLIALTSFSPISSGSSSLYRMSYWRTWNITERAKPWERCIWLLTGAYIKPHLAIVFSTIATFITIILFTITANAYSLFLVILLITFITATFWFFIGSLTRYYLFNKYPLRTSAKFLAHFFFSRINSYNRKKSIKNSKKYKTYLKKFIGYSNLLRASNNFELLQEIANRFTSNAELIPVIEEVRSEGKNWIIYLGILIEPSYERVDSEKAFKLLLMNILISSFESEGENNTWRYEWILKRINENLKNVKRCLCGRNLNDMNILLSQIQDMNFFINEKNFQELVKSTENAEKPSEKEGKMVETEEFLLAQKMIREENEN